MVCLLSSRCKGWFEACFSIGSMFLCVIVVLKKQLIQSYLLRNDDDDNNNVITIYD